MSVTANLRSSAIRSPAFARWTSSNRSVSVPNADSATAIVTSGPSTVSAIAATNFARMVTGAPSQAGQGGVWCAHVLLFVILGHTPIVLLVCLIGLLYLTWVELRSEALEPIVQLWWYLLVFMTNL